MVPYIRPHPSEWCKNRPAFLMLRNLSRIRQSLILLSHYKKEKASPHRVIKNAHSVTVTPVKDENVILLKHVLVWAHFQIGI